MTIASGVRGRSNVNGFFVVQDVGNAVLALFFCVGASEHFLGG